MFPTRAIVSRVFNQTMRRHYGGHGSFRPPTMDELPVPSGSWQANHDAKQRGYNTVLALSVIFTAATITIAKSTGLIYLNYSPPKSLD